jgi:hypothetical protein
MMIPPPSSHIHTTFLFLFPLPSSPNHSPQQLYIHTRGSAVGREGYHIYLHRWLFGREDGLTSGVRKGLTQLEGSVVYRAEPACGRGFLQYMHTGTNRPFTLPRSLSGRVSAIYTFREFHCSTGNYVQKLTRPNPPTINTKIITRICMLMIQRPKKNGRYWISSPPKKKKKNSQTGL